LGPQRAPLNSTTHRSDWDIDTINSNNFTGIVPIGLGHRSGFPQLSSAVDASHHTPPGTTTSLLPCSKEKLLPTKTILFPPFFFFFFHKGKKRKIKASSQSVPRSTMSMTTPLALGGAWVGNQDARCRLQKGNDAAAPTTPSLTESRGKRFHLHRCRRAAKHGRCHRTTIAKGTTTMPRARVRTGRPWPTVPPRHRRHIAAHHPDRNHAPRPPGQ
jgi:hypothetical protein